MLKYDIDRKADVTMKEGVMMKMKECYANFINSLKISYCFLTQLDMLKLRLGEERHYQIDMK